MPGSYPCPEVFFKIGEGCILKLDLELWCRNEESCSTVKHLQSMFLFGYWYNRLGKKRIETFAYVNEKKWITVK